MQTRPQLSISPSPANVRNVRNFLNDGALRPRILHEVIYKIIALDNTNRDSNEDIIGVFKEYLQVTKDKNPQYLGIKEIKAMMMQDFIKQHFFKLENKLGDGDNNVARIISRILTILDIDPASLLQQHANKDIDHKATKTIKLSRNRQPVIPGEAAEQESKIPQIPTSSSSSSQKAVPGITAVINTIAFLNEDEKKHLENEIRKEAAKVGMPPATLFEFLDGLPQDMGNNDNIPFEIKRTAFTAFVDEQANNNNKQILNYLFYHSIINASYNALELLVEKLVKAKMSSIFLDENKLNISMDFLVGQYGVNAAINLMNKVDSLIIQFEKLYSEKKETRNAHTVCDAFSKPTPTVNPLKPGVPQIPTVSQPVKISLPQPSNSICTNTFFTKPSSLCISVSIQKILKEFVNEISFFNEAEKEKLLIEIPAAAKRAGSKSVTDFIVSLKEKTQSKYVDKKVLEKLRTEIDNYLQHNNINILQYLFYNSVVSNNKEVAAFMFCELHLVERKWSLDNDNRYDFVKGLLFQTHGAQACVEMDEAISILWKLYENPRGENATENVTPRIGW